MDFEFDTERKSIPQGDVYLIPIKKIPAEAMKKPVEVGDQGYHIVTHSETGHHHVVMEREDVKMFSGMDMFRDFLRVAEDCELVHLRENHTHETQVITPGDWLIQRQASYTPSGWQRAID